MSRVAALVLFGTVNLVAALGFQPFEPMLVYGAGWTELPAVPPPVLSVSSPGGPSPAGTFLLP